MAARLKIFGAIAVLLAHLGAGQTENPPAEPAAGKPAQASRQLPRIRVAKDGRRFETTAGRPFVPWGVNYFRPGTGWAPQVWKRFDGEAIGRDLVQMRQMGVNCVRVFLSYGSFFTREDKRGSRVERVRFAWQRGKVVGR